MIREYFSNKTKRTIILTGLLAVGAATLFYCGLAKDKGTVVINEVCGNNFCAYCNEAGEYTDYVELYNMSGEDVEGLYLSDNRKHPKKYKIEVAIPANGYYLASISKDVDGGFGISKSGESLYLCDERGKVIDSVAIPELSYDVTYSRKKDGNGKFERMSATPGATNEGAAYIDADTEDEPKFSIEDGFYIEGTKLKISASPWTDIYYTDDGSVPDKTSHKYKGEIELADASEKDNVYANEIMYPTYAPPAYKVDKANIISAVAINKFTGEKSEVVTHTYFVGFDKKEKYKDMRIMSLVFDPADLFDHDRGIYTLGKRYDEYLELGGFTDLPADEVPGSFVDENGEEQFRSSFTNSEYKGREAERRAHMTAFDAAHDSSFAQDIGVRISGESTRFVFQKSLNLFARDIYDGEKRFKQSFVCNNEKKVRLRKGDGRILYQEPFIQSVMGEIGIPYQESVPEVLFINGEYWGIYNLREQYDSNYFEEHFGIPEDQLWAEKNNTVENGDAQTDENYKSLIDRMCYSDMSDDEIYSSIESEIDINNMIDYYCMLLFFNDTDIDPDHNRFMFRSKEPGYGDYGDGRWRYAAYDLDITCDDAEADTVAYYRELGEKMFWPGFFYERPGFKELFYDRMVELTENELSYEHLSKKLSEWDKVYRKQNIENVRRFEGINYTEKDYEKDLLKLDTFFKERKQYVLEMLENDINTY
ncbi:CotH kinase family protein [Butyrivibrio sp. LB2008]|uniref:CotH kinase family protein n=1 Tax=Butyrivibrio sp. LB2008 TaxID=1408305 RepID=UPI00047A2CEE|nr:CotH kinase family protein [Butyrivibrio sp. LB2008]